MFNVAVLEGMAVLEGVAALEGVAVLGISENAIYSGEIQVVLRYRPVFILNIPWSVTNFRWICM